jgi:hypothetical protein
MQEHAVILHKPDLEDFMKKSKLSLEEYIERMEGCVDAWNRADAELVASYYSDTIDYRDPTVPAGIGSKKELVEYLELIFKVWPRQQWTAKKVMPHAEQGAFSVDYAWKIANDAKSLSGTGIDRIEFEGDKIRLNHVYLNAEKWKEWIGNELKKK